MSITFTQAHPRQRANALIWLRKMRAEIDAEIRALECEAAAEKESVSARAAFNALMKDLISENCTVKQAENRLVQQGWGNSDISGSAKVLKRLAARRRREMRDAEILRRVIINCEAPADLAREYKISRKQVYVILKKADPMKKEKAGHTVRPE